MSGATGAGAVPENIVEAIEWYTNYRPVDGTRRPIVPLLRERFQLTAQEACRVLAEVNLRRARAS